MRQRLSTSIVEFAELAIKCGRSFPDAHLAREACETLASLDGDAEIELAKSLRIDAAIANGLIKQCRFSVDAIAWLEDRGWAMTRLNLAKMQEMLDCGRPDGTAEELVAWKLCIGAWWLARKIRSWGDRRPRT